MGALRSLLQRRPRSAGGDCDQRLRLDAQPRLVPRDGHRPVRDALDPVSTAAGFYAPLPGGPLVDKGNPAVLAAGESTTDFAGHPRVSSNSCTPIRDIGARELQQATPSCVPPGVPPPSGRHVVPQAPSNAFTITRVKAGKKGTVVTLLGPARARSPRR